MAKELGANHLDVISIDVTNECNLSCKHCYNYSGDQTIYSGKLTEKELRDTIKQAIELSPTSVCICGGEPLLEKEIVIELIKTLKENQIKTVNMVSNGFLLDECCARDLKDAGIDFVQISVDGYTEESHNWLRNNLQSHKLAIDAIKNLRKERIRVGVACTPTKKNIGEIDQLADYLNSLGVFVMRMQPIMRIGRAKEMFSFFPSDEDYTKLSMKLNSKIRDKNYKMKFEWGDPIEHLYAIKHGVNLRSISINPYGDLLISPYIPLSFGNVRRHTIGDYISAGLCGVVKMECVQAICGAVKSEVSMDLSENTGLPELYKDEFFCIDLIDDDVQDKSKKLLSLIGGTHDH